MASYDEDRADVLDNPLWTKDTFAKSKSFAETFPDLAEKRQRRPEKVPKKVSVTIQLDPRVVDHFKAGGTGWQARMVQALNDIVNAKKSA